MKNRMTVKQRADVYMLGFEAKDLTEYNRIRIRFQGMPEQVLNTLLDGFLDSLTAPEKRSVVLD